MFSVNYRYITEILVAPTTAKSKNIIPILEKSFFLQREKLHYRHTLIMRRKSVFVSECSRLRLPVTRVTQATGGRLIKKTRLTKKLDIMNKHYFIRPGYCFSPSARVSIALRSSSILST